MPPRPVADGFNPPRAQRYVEYYWVLYWNEWGMMQYHPVDSRREGLRVLSLVTGWGMLEVDVYCRGQYAAERHEKPPPGQPWPPQALTGSAFPDEVRRLKLDQ